MQSTPSPRRASLLTIILWGIPVLCSVFFATQLLLAFPKIPAAAPVAKTIPKGTAKAQSDSTTPELISTPSKPILTPPQIEELLASIPKFANRPVWDRRPFLIMYDRMNKNLFAQLGLSHEKAAEFRSLLIEREHARSRMHIALSKAGLSFTDILSATKEIMQRYDQKIEQCLGPEDYKVFVHRNQNSGNYSILDDVISSLSVTEHPLADDKKRELYAAVLKTPNDEAFMTAVSQALPPEQNHLLLEAIETVTLQYQLYQMRMEIYRQRQAAVPNQ